MLSILVQDRSKSLRLRSTRLFGLGLSLDLAAEVLISRLVPGAPMLFFLFLSFFVAADAKKSNMITFERIYREIDGD